MFEHRSEEMELMDDLSLTGDDVSKNLNEIEICNRAFGSNRTLIKALSRIHEKFPDDFSSNKLVIADLGCGGGDLIMLMEQWAKSRKLTIDFIGIDANPYMIQYAINKSRTANNIEYKVMNILSPEFAQIQFDIITVNSVCHHFKDNTLISLFKQLTKQARLAVIINDLHRHWLSYYGIKFVAKIFRFSRLTSIDAPLSVLRSFRKNELLTLLQKSQLTSYQLSWAWLFRWVIIIWSANERKSHD